MNRVRAEFDEMPGLALTLGDAARFFGLESDVARSVFDQLIATSYLRWTIRGELTRTAR
ncbi:MAG: hypothetical protein AB7Q29_00690 [Vicinamibacterales bacterium]